MKRTVIFAVAALVVIVVAIFLLRNPAPPRETALTGVAERFMTILPADMPAAQKTEIEGLLKRFMAKAEANMVRAEDYQEVMQLIAAHVNKGAIDRTQLNLLMAKVGYYSYRAQSPDSSDIHPLLEPMEEWTDSARRPPR